MNRIRLAAAAVNQTPMAWDTNSRHLRAAMTAARDAGVGILCLPELCITGYGCEDMFFSAGVQTTALDVLQELVPDTKGLVTCLGLPVFYQGAVYNAVAVACDGRLLGLVAKQHLAGDGIHYEPRWFRRWPTGVVGSIDIGGQEYPLGDLLFDCRGVRIGFEICRDAWVADRTGAKLAQRGADVLLNPSASHFAFAKQQIRERFVLEGSRAFCVSYAYANLLGNEAGRAIYDGGTLIAMGGKMLARGPRFSFADWVLTSAVIDVDSTRRAKSESFLDTDPQPADASDANSVAIEFEFPDAAEPAGTVSIATGIAAYREGEAPAEPSATANRGSAETSPSQVPGHPDWETGQHQKEEEFARSVALALFDYLRKSGAQGFLVSLSGGADSSTVAVLVHLLAQLGGRELGFDQLTAKLPRIKSLSQDVAEFARIPTRESTGLSSHYFNYGERADVDGRAFVGNLLTCVYQATRNSGSQTFEAAQAAAAAVGAEFFHWNVDAMIDGYVQSIAAATGRELNWNDHDTALQNIQARARGPGIWLLANLRDALLLTTSNRSEAAVGYATMDGDTCGGLAPIAGIDKAFLLEWLKWMETTGPAGVGPLPALAVINNLKPTAELRPPAADQTDEADLMPYRLLDAIERAAIRDKLLPIEVFDAVRPLFPQYDKNQIGTWV
ncbi:MAG TPA: nitrilase-related carbon-nitrogen hydrolase, partial [Lacipirellulaceae bacterium]|nr:nitrilase-related carbon-nitrogen hydrolase [Lacipirellulaceae bacterium]